MSESVYLDNDVVLKLCLYRSVTELIDATTINSTRPAILGVAKYTLTSHVDRSPLVEDREEAKRSLECSLKFLRLLEPEADEIQAAADLEQRAAEQNLELDAGESQLIAMLLSRHSPLLVTGDKRAMRALGQLGLRGAKEKIACLEQLMTSIIRKSGHESVRSRVCAARGVDRAVTASFACHSPSVSMGDVLDGLLSYTNDLRRHTQGFLIVSDDLSAVIS